MEFLVRVRVRFPSDIDAGLKAAIMREERERGAALRASGHLLRAWRIPGRVEALLLWRVKHATELHDIISSLPVYPYCAEVEVEALAEHPIDPTSHEPRPAADRSD
ncbi:muconolactone Delta-isomerase family protein [Streptomyces sp. NBC_01622]|uniref:muconolactone Delta-isomerase n=1 Tax=Streptomyces sp. NBC_01622 TaxID=2975903 RepID=UPI00386355C8|nr:muconolactone Delta-isomerase family protein [Streptomyces sp. NBC_01622]